MEQCRSMHRRRPGVDQVERRFRLHEINPTVQIRPAGELAGDREPGPRRAQRVEDELRRENAPVSADFEHGLAGIGRAGLEPRDYRVVHHATCFGMGERAIRGSTGGEIIDAYGRADLERVRSAYTDDRDPGSSRSG